MLTKTWRRGAALTAGLGVAVTMLTVPATPAAAFVPGNPPCVAASCVGKTPYLSSRGTSCAFGYQGEGAAYDVPGGTITLPGYGSSVTLRYSPTCEANWARLNYEGAGYITFQVYTEDGREAEGYSWVAANYTTMVDGSQLAKVCIQSNSGDQVCTSLM